MKHLIFAVFVITIFSSMKASMKSTKVTYNYIKAEGMEKAVLYFNNEYSFFNYNTFDKNKGERTKVDDSNFSEKITYINNSDSIGTYQLITNDSIYERRQVAKTYYMILETSTPLNWTFVDSTQKIGNYNCQLATTECYGRQFYAWYTVKIPSNTGPWKLGGLPGLILYAYDSSKRHVWKATNIEFDVEFDFFWYSTNEERISLKEYAELLEKYYERIVKFGETIAAQQGASVSFERKTNYIEEEFER